MSTQPANRIHRIYLLTIWQEAGGQEDGRQPEEENWRFLVEDPRSGRRKGFANVTALVEGLLAMVVEETQASVPVDDQDA
ncbi:MAG: hypothetical protein R3C14_15280 [Caldilineaceae bacterium]